MNKKITWIIGVLALVLLIGGASILYHRMSAEAAPPPVATAPPEEVEDTEEEVVEPVSAPDFTAMDSDGNLVSLSDNFEMSKQKCVVGKSLCISNKDFLIH